MVERGWLGVDAAGGSVDGVDGWLRGWLGVDAAAAVVVVVVVVVASLSLQPPAGAGLSICAQIPMKRRREESTSPVSVAKRPCRAEVEAAAAPRDDALASDGGDYQRAIDALASDAAYRSSSAPSAIGADGQIDHMRTVVGRTEEWQRIWSMVEGALAGMATSTDAPRQRSLYISGTPGTGKTATLLDLQRVLEEQHRGAVAYVNGMEHRKADSIFQVRKHAPTRASTHAHTRPRR